MPKSLEKINLKTMILTLSLLSGLTLTAVNNSAPRLENGIQSPSRNPVAAEVAKQVQTEIEEEETI
jgi:hypothetical protein